MPRRWRRRSRRTARAATSPRSQALARARALRLHRSARLLARAADRQRAVHAGVHLHGAPPGHDASWRSPTCCSTARRSAGAWPMPHVEAVASLLHERAPREVSLLHAPPSGPPPQALQRRAPGLLREVLPGATALEPTHLLSNGRYSVSLRANGAGCEPLGRDRHHALARRRAARRLRQLLLPALGPPAAAGLDHPAPGARPGRALPEHLPRRPRRASTPTWPELQAHATVWVSPEDDIEFRQVELRNLSDRTLDIELMSAFEVTLADPRADEAHPAFSQPVRAAPSGRPQHQALVFERKPRLATEHGPARRALPGRQRPAGAGRAAADRPPALARPQPRREPAAGVVRRAAATRRRRRASRSTPASTRSARWRCACASRRNAQGAADLRHRGVRRRATLARGDRQVPPARATCSAPR